MIFKQVIKLWMVSSVVVEIRDWRDHFSKELRDRNQISFTVTRVNFECHYSMFKKIVLC